MDEQLVPTPQTAQQGSCGQWNSTLNWSPSMLNSSIATENWRVLHDPKKQNPKFPAEPHKIPIFPCTSPSVLHFFLSLNSSIHISKLAKGHLLNSESCASGDSCPREADACLKQTQKQWGGWEAEFGLSGRKHPAGSPAQWQQETPRPEASQCCRRLAAALTTGHP